MCVVLGLLGWFTVGCQQKLSEENVQDWAQNFLKEMEDYYLMSDMTVEMGKQEARHYRVEERYLAQGSARVDFINQNNKMEHQIFINTDDQLRIYHQGLEEQYHINNPKIHNKLSFLYLDLLTLIAEEVVSPTVKEIETGYELLVSHENKGIDYLELYLNEKLSPTKLNLYRNDTQEPFLRLQYHEVYRNESVVAEEDFQERVFDMAFSEADEEKCQLSVYCEQTLQEVDLPFTPVLPKGKEIVSIHPCESSNWLSMRINACNEQSSEGNEKSLNCETQEFVVIQKYLPEKEHGERSEQNQKRFSDLAGYNEKLIAGQSIYINAQRDGKVAKWISDNIEMTVRGENETQLLKVVKSLIN